jgi:hypothetical protein
MVACFDPDPNDLFAALVGIAAPCLIVIVVLWALRHV